MEPRQLGWMLVTGAIVAGAIALYSRNGAAPLPASEEAPRYVAADAHEGVERPLATTTDDAAVVAPAASARADERAVLATFGWGKGRGQLGRPRADEGEAESPLRVTALGDDLLFLDVENDRVVRLGRDGGVGDVIRLPVADAKDLVVAKDGTLLLRWGKSEDGKITLVGPDGKTRGSLSVPPDLAGVSRGVLVSGNDVYVEALDGELRRVGDTSGHFDGDAGVAPGLPTKDGRGYLGARIADPETGAVHVFVVDRASLAQRFSRLLRARLFVEGIFLVDTNAAGTIYIGVSGPMPGNDDEHLAELICLDGDRGDVIGAIELGVRVGKETIIDAKALEAGGVVLSISTDQGVRVERRDCT